MIDKIQSHIDQAIDPITDGAVIMVGGFGDTGIPAELLAGLRRQGTRRLTLISNNAGTFETGIAALVLNGQVEKVICSHPRPPTRRC